MIDSPNDIRDVTFAIRDAVAPVFLLTGIGSLLSVLVNRLGRAIDRARGLNGLNDQQLAPFLDELDIIVRRIAWMRWAVGLFIFAGFCVSLSIATVFVGVELKINLPHFVLLTFITSMVALNAGLLCFLREIILATKEAVTRHR
ncbi:MAG: DUF2721 domain-containing protein [Candidatus Methylopumilus sp.]|jgi:hypothetical protein|nr:DUF2721 domain-containing protein [Candidatus Methylopumilus sp.]NBW60430.1 DUF2721 domain-containing protein [Methylophilaceae bacterium]